jgi:hypothetical protein
VHFQGLKSTTQSTGCTLSTIEMWIMRSSYRCVHIVCVFSVNDHVTSGGGGGCRRCQVCAACTLHLLYATFYTEIMPLPVRSGVCVYACAIFSPPSPLSPPAAAAFDEWCLFICVRHFSKDLTITLTLWSTALLTSRLGFKPSPSQRTLHSFDSQRLLAQSSEEISCASSQQHYTDHRRPSKLNNARFAIF